MIKKIEKLTLLAVSALLLFSCAVEKEESSNDIQKRVLDAYLETYYPDLTPESSGLVYLEKSVGTGKQMERGYAAYLNYTTQTLDGVYASSNDTSVAKQLGTFTKSNYFGPRIYEVGYGTAYIGVEEMLLGLKEGGKATAIIPPWLTTTEYSTSSQGSSVSMFHTYEIVTIIEDIIQFEADTMASYAANNYPGLDSLFDGFYFKLISEPTNDSIPNDSTVNVRYVGKLLDGFVFDTNIADSARKYGIYDPDKAYSSLSVTVEEDSVSMATNTGLVQGFCMGVQNLNYGEWGFVMFKSGYGYGSTGSTDEYGNVNNIGPYQPLIFYMYIEEEEEQ